MLLVSFYLKTNCQQKIILENGSSRIYFCFFSFREVVKKGQPRNWKRRRSQIRRRKLRSCDPEVFFLWWNDIVERYFAPKQEKVRKQMELKQVLGRIMF